MPPEDPTVGNSLGPYGDPRGGAVSYEQRTSVGNLGPRKLLDVTEGREHLRDSSSSSFSLSRLELSDTQVYEP